MPDSYLYTACSPDGTKRQGIIQADSVERVAAILDEQHLIPLEIKARKNLSRPALFGFMKSRQYEDLILFTRNLSTLYQAGIPILRALGIIKIGPPDSYFNLALERIRSAVQSGRSLSEAMSDYPHLFSKIFTASIAAGETSGHLDTVLDALGVMLERDLELNRQIKSAVRYPLMVTTAIAGAFIALITFVIPRFASFYSEMGAKLPAPTRALIFINQVVTHYWMLVAALAIILAIVLKRIYSSPSGRLFFDDLFLRLPVLGDLINKGNIARFSYMFHLLIRSGIPIVKSVEMLANTIKNTRLMIEIRILADSFREGRELTGLIEQMRYFPEMALQMIKIGLESGSLDLMLNEISKHYSKEVDYKSRHLTALLEPILTVVLGAFVLLVALAIFLPMWNLIQIFRH
ncbi:putative Type II secretion system protein F [Candidatus Zixiibacteriota bacterium]|nr:putative Type II secretion system protein F [candidate division Zixibacteria bacterium]